MALTAVVSRSSRLTSRASTVASLLAQSRSRRGPGEFTEIRVTLPRVVSQAGGFSISAPQLESEYGEDYAVPQSGHGAE